MQGGGGAGEARQEHERVPQVGYACNSTAHPAQAASGRNINGQAVASKDNRHQTEKAQWHEEQVGSRARPDLIPVSYLQAKPSFARTAQVHSWI